MTNTEIVEIIIGYSSSDIKDFNQDSNTHISEVSDGVVSQKITNVVSEMNEKSEDDLLEIKSMLPSHLRLNHDPC